MSQKSAQNQTNKSVPVCMLVCVGGFTLSSCSNFSLSRTGVGFVGSEQDRDGSLWTKEGAIPGTEVERQETVVSLSTLQSTGEHHIPVKIMLSSSSLWSTPSWTEGSGVVMSGGPVGIGLGLSTEVKFPSGAVFGPLLGRFPGTL